MANGNPIKYTSRTYQTILNDINLDTDLASKPNWWKQIWAGVGDVLSLMMNAIANLLLLRTSYTRQAVTDLLQLIDYQLSPHSTSNGNLTFYVSRNAILPVVFTAGDLIGSTTGSVAVSAKQYASRTGLTFSSITEAILPAAVNISTDELTIANTYVTGDLIRISTTDTLPAPLQVNTDYYVIYVNATTIRLAVSLANAYNGNQINLTTQGVGTHTLQQYSFTVIAYQQEEPLQNPVIGTSDGITSWQRFDLPDLLILRDTLTLTINAIEWTRVDTLVNSLSTDTHFELIYQSNNSAYILFGNSTYGAIPPAFDITANYAYGGGADSNISSLNRINQYAGGNADITGVSNTTTFSGGSDAEDIATAKILGPLLLKARDRYVTSGDGTALASAYDGVAHVKTNRNQYGILSSQVLVIPNGGGTPSSQLLTDLQTYLIDRTILESVDVRVEAPDYVVVNPTFNVKVEAGYTFAGIENYVKLASVLLFSETTREIVTIYNGSGIAAAILFINNTFGFSFDENDYTQIIELLQAIDPIDFGESYQTSDVLGYIDQSVTGVDYVTTNLTFPLTLDIDQIFQHGTTTVVEIT